MGDVSVRGGRRAIAKATGRAACLAAVEAIVHGDVADALHRAQVHLCRDRASLDESKARSGEGRGDGGGMQGERDLKVRVGGVFNRVAN